MIVLFFCSRGKEGSVRTVSRKLEIAALNFRGFNHGSEEQGGAEIMGTMYSSS